MDHLQVAAANTGLVLQMTQAHVGPPVTAAHLLLLAVAAVRLVADVGAAPRPLARDNIGVNSIMVRVIANTVVDLLQTKNTNSFISRTLKFDAHLEDGSLGADLLPQLALVGEGHVRRRGGGAHWGEDLGARLYSVALGFYRISIFRKMLLETNIDFCRSR